MRKSFTLIELIVVIGIIAVLSALGATSYNGFQKNARDNRRKQDLKTITAALNQYYAANNRFPYPNPGGVDASQPTCPNGGNYNCYVFSDAGNDWIPLLISSGYTDQLPVDPINVVAGTTGTGCAGKGPWNCVYNNYIYSYGNVPSNGQTYDLTARLENTDDPDRCGVKFYKWYFNTPLNDWCNTGTYSDQIYELSPRSF